MDKVYKRIKIITSMSNSQMKEACKFPRIGQKSKSVPSNTKTPPASLNFLTAKSWFYCTGTLQYGFKSSAKREIASLTKIMTALCSLALCEKYKINLKTTYFKVTQWACSTIGTTADLIQNAWMTVEDLLFGLMLPSGNDSATVLCQNLGAVLYFDKAGNKSLIQEIRSIDLTEDYESVKFYTQQFISFMNQVSRDLNMNKTRFANPHGLDHINNYSCCEDVYVMCREAMKNQVFRRVVGTATHKGIFKFFREGKVVCKPIFWTNTNRLLQDQTVTGIKTGITNKAGGCLATSFLNEGQHQEFIVVLGCSSTDSRFRDTIKIMNWAAEQSLNETN